MHMHMPYACHAHERMHVRTCMTGCMFDHLDALALAGARGLARDGRPRAHAHVQQSPRPDGKGRARRLGAWHRVLG